MKRAEFRHREALRVRWAEVDLQKIVFNGHYPMYVDTAVAGYWRAMALPYHDTMERLQGDLYVRKATLEYEGSARYDERLEVGIRCGRIGNSSMVFSAGVFRGEQVLVHGELVYVFADPHTQTSRPVPPELRACLQAFEAGEPMVGVALGDWPAQQAEAMRLRQAVFAQEQGIPAELMSDEADATAVHALARNRAVVNSRNSVKRDQGDGGMRTRRCGSPGGASPGGTTRLPGIAIGRPLASYRVKSGANIRIGSIATPSSVAW